MYAYHNSRNSVYRTPFGAVALGSKVSLALDVYNVDEPRVTLRTWQDGKGETCVQTKQDKKITLEDGARYVASIKPTNLEICWYYFIIEDKKGNKRFYGPQQGHVGGEGMLFEYEPPSYQITVYKERDHYPEWFETALVYQIFPDRYKRGKDWKKRVQTLQESHKGVARVFEPNWNKLPSYTKDKAGDVTHWDFYGGTLQGIIEDLPRIKSMGFSAIYLNPIFKAQSNHRYDTGNYLQIDSVLGDEKTFVRLCKHAKKLGISIILDGVFNHTGVDSLYFNRYGNYDSEGAWKNPNSPYRDWYLFHHMAPSTDGNDSYDSWWGVKDLPTMNKQCKAWQEFVYGKDGVVEKWLKLGARGWRLDVADELNDAFLMHIKQAEDRVNPEALLLGEVWEDASNKVAYSEMRHYLCGEELDSVMNYPFRDSVLAYLMGDTGASGLAECMMQLKENYPPHAFYETLNLLGSHDRPRVLSVLGGALGWNTDAPEDERGNHRHENGVLKLAKGRLMLALLIQMLSPGVPCVFYGDEVGLQGLADPYNRATYPWNHEDVDTKKMYEAAIRLRLNHPEFVHYDVLPFSVGEDVYAFWRFVKHLGLRFLVAVNRSLEEEHVITVDVRPNAQVEGLFGDCKYILDEDGLHITLPRLGGCVFLVDEAAK